MKKQSPRKEGSQDQTSKDTSPKEASKKKVVNWLCIRECYDSDARYWNVGDEFRAVEPPAARHFIKVPTKGLNPIDVMREKLEDLDIVYDERWGLDRLTNEVKLAEDHIRRTEESRRRREEDARNNPTN